MQLRLRQLLRILDCLPQIRQCHRKRPSTSLRSTRLFVSSCHRTFVWSIGIRTRDSFLLCWRWTCCILDNRLVAFSFSFHCRTFFIRRITRCDIRKDYVDTLGQNPLIDKEFPGDGCVDPAGLGGAIPEGMPWVISPGFLKLPRGKAPDRHSPRLWRVDWDRLFQPRFDGPMLMRPVVRRGRRGRAAVRVRDRGP